MPQVTSYQPAAATSSFAQPATGKALSLRTAPAKNVTTTALTTATPLPRPAGIMAPGSVAASSAVPSLTHSGDGENVDLIDLIDTRLSQITEPTVMDRAMVKQAQVSGQLNAKQQELAELQALAQRRLKSARKNFGEGIKAAKEVKKDLEWTQKAINDLNLKASQKHSNAFATATSHAPPLTVE